MGTRTVDGGARRWKAVQVGGGVAVLAGVLFALPDLHRPPPPSTALDRSDIHTEYVKFPSGRDTITAYLAYPERKDPAPVVVVIHEIFGMSDFIRQTTEQLAKDGFVAIAPDLLSRRGGTPPSPDDARKLIAGLDPDTVTKDLDATVGYVKRLKAARPDRVGVIGFCWGGGQSFRYATNNPFARGIRRLLWARPRRHVHRAHPGEGARRLRRERRAHQRRPERRGRGDPDVPQDLPVYRVSRRRPRLPAGP